MRNTSATPLHPAAYLTGAAALLLLAALSAHHYRSDGMSARVAWSMLACGWIIACLVSAKFLGLVRRLGGVVQSALLTIFLSVIYALVVPVFWAVSKCLDLVRPDRRNPWRVKHPARDTKRFFERM